MILVGYFKTFLFAAIATIGFGLLGCGSSGYPSVSGVITSGGTPVVGVQVLYTPMASGKNHTPGPYSIGVSDENGRYNLKTRYGDQGAVPGRHKVGFNYGDTDPGQMGSLQLMLREAKGDGAKETKLRAQIAELKEKLRSRPKNIMNKEFQIDITAEGATDANFELDDA